MFGRKKIDETTQRALNGAWEERGVVGSRVEIDADKLTVLWRGGVVLQTTFTAETTEDGVTLSLKQNGLRYKGSASDYASVTGLILRGDVLEFIEYFPITGESRTNLTKTDNTRYGAYDYADEMMSALQGTWQDQHGFFRLVFEGDTVTINGNKRKIRVLRSRSSPDTYLVADADPSVDEWPGMSLPTYRGGLLTAYVPVCDAPNVDLIFTRI